MFCTNCGSQIEDDAKFCTNCGAKTDAAVEDRAQTAATPSAQTVQVRQAAVPQAAVQTPDGRKIRHGFTTFYLWIILLGSGMPGLYITSLGAYNVCLVANDKTPDLSMAPDFVRHKIEFMAEKHLEDLQSYIIVWCIFLLIYGLSMLDCTRAVVLILNWKGRGYYMFKVMQFVMAGLLVLCHLIYTEEFINKFTITCAVSAVIGVAILKGVLHLRNKYGANTFRQLE